MTLPFRGRRYLMSGNFNWHEFSNVTPHEERKRVRYQYIYIVRFS